MDNISITTQQVTVKPQKLSASWTFERDEVDVQNIISPDFEHMLITSMVANIHYEVAIQKIGERSIENEPYILADPEYAQKYLEFLATFMTEKEILLFKIENSEHFS